MLSSPRRVAAIASTVRAIACSRTRWRSFSRD